MNQIIGCTNFIRMFIIILCFLFQPCNCRDPPFWFHAGEREGADCVEE